MHVCGLKFAPQHLMPLKTKCGWHFIEGIYVDVEEVGLGKAKNTARPSNLLPPTSPVF